MLKIQRKNGWDETCKKEKEIKIIFCHPTSIWVFKVPNSGVQVYSLIHMTEAEFVKVDVEQVNVCVQKCFCILKDSSFTLPSVKFLA